MTPRFVVTAPIVAHTPILASEFSLTFHAPQIAAAAQPGQFVELTYGDGLTPLLRRPFSLFAVDREAGTCRVFYRIHGAFTSGLTRLTPGDHINVLGPLGRPYTWEAEAGIRHILIAGGIGAPPLHFLASELCRAAAPPDVVVINGARTQELLVGMQEFEGMAVELIAVTEDGSQKTEVKSQKSEEPNTQYSTPNTEIENPTPSVQRGLVTEVLTTILDAESAKESVVSLYACGPMPMLKAIAVLAIARNVPCQVSIETSMPCGIGLCQGCAVRVRETASPEAFRYALACVDGPVFDADALLWV